MLEHDLSQAVDAGFVILWVRDRLFIKLKDLMSTEAALKPGLAAKMFDLMNVLGERTFWPRGLYTALSEELQDSGVLPLGP